MKHRVNILLQNVGELPDDKPLHSRGHYFAHQRVTLEGQMVPSDCHVLPFSKEPVFPESQNVHGANRDFFPDTLKHSMQLPTLMFHGNTAHCYDNPGYLTGKLKICLLSYSKHTYLLICMFFQ
jgi:hypothetical protein